MSQLPSELYRKKEIEQFLKKRGAKLSNANVPEMRHIIPLLMMEVYKYSEEVKKAKGIWYKPPEDWPADIPFQDPSNAKMDDNGKTSKPKKEQLWQMLNHLIARYEDMDSDGSDMNYYDPDQSLPVKKKQLELSEEAMNYKDSNIDPYDSMMEVFERIMKKLETLYINLQMAASLSDNSIATCNDLRALEKNIDMVSNKVTSGISTDLQMAAALISDNSTEANDLVLDKVTLAPALTEPDLSEDQAMLPETAPENKIEAFVDECHIKYRSGDYLHTLELAKKISFRYVAQASPEVENVDVAKTSTLSDSCKPVQTPEDNVQQVEEASESGSQVLRKENSDAKEEDSDVSSVEIFPSGRDAACLSAENIGLQSHAVSSRKEIKPGWKRHYPLEDDNMMDFCQIQETYLMDIEDTSDVQAISSPGVMWSGRTEDLSP